MTDTTTVAENSDLIEAVLEGGPASITEALRSRTINPSQEKIKLQHYGGYEHFERTDRTGANIADGYVVFRWTKRTEIAE